MHFTRGGSPVSPAGVDPRDGSAPSGAGHQLLDLLTALGARQRLRSNARARSAPL
jgi:hypothetical protein